MSLPRQENAMPLAPIDSYDEASQKIRVSGQMDASTGSPWWLNWMLLAMASAALLIVCVLRPSMKPPIVNGGFANQESPRKFALLVGIDKYRYSKKAHFPDLKGCVNDVTVMKELLVHKYGFEPRNVKLLTDFQATHAAIIQAIKEHLLAQVRADDIVVFEYSGHGSQVANPTKINGYDETIVPTDSRDPDGKVFDITGDEMNALLRSIGAITKNITIIMDSCHSGGLVRERNLSGLVRRIPADARKQPPLQVTADSQTRSRDVGFAPTTLKYAFIAAARSDENAFEYSADHIDYGVLTYFLHRKLLASGTNLSYRDVMDEIKSQVSTAYPSQHPQLEGADQDQSIFNIPMLSTVPYITIGQATNSEVLLQAGQVLGLTEGSLFDVYPPETKDFGTGVKPSATVQVTKVRAFDADAKVTSGGPVVILSRAIEREHYYPDAKLTIFLDGIRQSGTLRLLHKALANFKNLVVVTEPSPFDLRITEESSRIVIRSADSTVQLSAIAMAEDGVNTAVDQIGEWVKWFNVLRIANANPTIDVTFKISPIATHTQANESDLVLAPGERFRCTFENHSDRNVYLSLVDLASDSSVQVAYQTTALPLTPGSKFTTGEFEARIAEGRDSVTDILKLFATDTPVDFSFLNQKATRTLDLGTNPKGTNSPLGQLIAQSAFGYGRQITSVPSNWTTVQRYLKVQKAHR